MQEELKAFEDKKPEIVFEWNDPETGARGWAVINSLRGGAAGGGTRMRKGLDKHEVISLAKTMEVKFTVAGPQIGGAKSGIDFDPADPRKNLVLDKWFSVVTPLLKQYYGTGGDLNVDEVHDVITLTRKYGLLHPQEGVVNGHLGSDIRLKENKISRLRDGVVLPVTSASLAPGKKTYTVADMITGFGVAESVRHYYDIYGGNLQGKRVIIQGWGNVGAAAGLYLSRYGATITAIIDKEGGVMRKDGFTQEEVRMLFTERSGNKLESSEMISHREMENMVWNSGAEIFIPAAASRLVNRDQIELLIRHGLEVISCGANVPFDDPEIFFGPTGTFADLQISLIPDFISNCGMARAFAYLITSDGPVTDEAIFGDVSTTIRNALAESYLRQPHKTRIGETALAIALDKLRIKEEIND